MTMKTNSPEEFRELLRKMVKAAGQEIIDRADDLVGDGDLMNDFDIRINFSIDGRMVDMVPEIEVCRSYASKNCVDVLSDHYGG